MPVPTTNVGLSDIAAEFGGATPHALSEYRGYGTAPASGAIAFSDLAGASAGLTVKASGYIICSSTNSNSYSGSLSASIVSGDTIIIAKNTGYGNYDYGSDTINGGTPTYHISNRIWSSPLYSHYRVMSRVATASASSVSWSCSEGTSNRTAMVCYCWVVSGGVSYEDSDSVYGNGSTMTVNTGGPALIIGTAYTWQQYSMPIWGSGATYGSDCDTDYHVDTGWALQTDSSSTYSMTVTRTGTANRVTSFT